MKIALYGMPCAGKSTLMDRITDAKVINGSQELRRICGGSFSELSEEEKHQVRIKYTEYINGLNDEVIVSDGHYSFMETVAFTEADGELYDIFIYLYCSPENLKERYALSEKNGKFAGESIESLRQWQEFEINNLREECHRRNKDFYVVSDNEEEQNKFFDFLSLLREGFSSYDLATDICNQIMEQFNKQDILYIVDGDKTIIIQDSYRFCCNGKTKIFDGDFYTGYQSFLFEKELQTASIDKSKIAEITINNEVYDIVASNNYVVLSSGIKDLWSDIANAKNLGTIFASPYISADVKYYVVKQLREHGYTIFAYGDSKIDLYMLREADKGFLYIGKRISRSLKNALAASDEVLIPVEASYLPIKGLQQLLKTIGKVRKQINPKLQVGGILFTMVDAHTNDARNNMELLRNVYGSQIHIFDNYIPFSVRMKEAVREGQSIFSYDPKGKATEAYRRVTEEVLEDAI